MQDQQKAAKVTLYLPNELHRQLRIRSAVDGEPMSAIAERALEFYMTHSDIVNGESEVCGHTHQVYSCPACAESMVMREGDLVPVKDAIAQSRGEKLTVDMQGMVPDSKLLEDKLGSELDGEELLVC